MMQAPCVPPSALRFRRPAFYAAWALVVSFLGSWAGADEVELTLPQPSNNAAVHYQRAMLFLASVDSENRSLLDKSVHEIVQGMVEDGKRESASELLVASRHAIRSALVGAGQATADFGVEPHDYVASAMTPHAYGMLDLSRLVLLRGIQAELADDWPGAISDYLNAVRMGRHMAEQQTLIEALVGLQMLEESYYTIALWSARCPDPELVERTGVAMKIMTRGAADPARTMALETLYLKLKLKKLAESYPDGDWADMLLEATDTPAPAGDATERREAAIKAATNRGAPASIFASADSFREHVTKLRAAYGEMGRSVTNALTLPPVAAVERGTEIFKKYGPQLEKLGDPAILHPGQIAAVFAKHEAAAEVLQVVLAAAAAKSDGAFPADLAALSANFGGELPTSPYDGSPVIYELKADGKGVSVSVKEVTVGEIALPGIRFSYSPE